MSLGVTSVCFLLWRRCCCLFLPRWVERGADIRQAPLATVVYIWCCFSNLWSLCSGAYSASGAVRRRCGVAPVQFRFCFRNLCGMLLLHLIYMRVAILPQLFVMCCWAADIMRFGVFCFSMSILAVLVAAVLTVTANLLTMSQS